MTIELTIQDIERHCNNYFNPQNTPSDPIRNHPAEFLELANRIYEYRKKIPNNDFIAETVVGLHSYKRSTTITGAPSTWQAIFATDLSIYKRVKFI